MFKEIKAEELQRNVFEAVGKDWMLVTTEAERKANAMTASWGGMGILWNRKVVFLVVRQTRCTKALLDQSELLSVAFSQDRDMLNYMGTASGRDEDKLKKCGLTIAYDEGIPYINEADAVLLLKKLYCQPQPFSPDGFVDGQDVQHFYADNDFHSLYVAEVVKVLVKE